MGAMCSNSSSSNPLNFSAPKADFVYTGQSLVPPRPRNPEDEVKENPYTKRDSQYERLERDWSRERHYIRNQLEMAAEKERKIQAEKERKAAEERAKREEEERIKKEAAEKLAA